MKFCTDIHGHQRMMPTDFVDSLAFHLQQPAGPDFELTGKISQHLLDGLAFILMQTLTAPT